MISTEKRNTLHIRNAFRMDVKYKYKMEMPESWMAICITNASDW